MDGGSTNPSVIADRPMDGSIDGLIASWQQVRSHAKSLTCTHIIGYSETCTIHDDVCILSCVGTAATLRNLLMPPDHLVGLDQRLLSESTARFVSSKAFAPDEIAIESPIPWTTCRVSASV